MRHLNSIFMRKLRGIPPLTYLGSHSPSGTGRVGNPEKGTNLGLGTCVPECNDGNRLGKSRKIKTSTTTSPHTNTPPGLTFSTPG
ncbi:hypothetical protein CDAR_276361 [Caerostris darwini]|uniref:Uncharacterized protein n=1 Tax=Caerostris darwini TaxID=1538125 RepID=A0AAV4MXT2_9ARAC|nr:hypothetical protein CDAR_276361 [Caerostris darwini]